MYLWLELVHLLAVVAFVGNIVTGVLAASQRRLRDCARAGAAASNFDLAAYERLSRQWDLWGAVATLAPLGALALMVLKPAF